MLWSLSLCLCVQTKWADDSRVDVSLAPSRVISILNTTFSFSVCLFCLIIRTLCVLISLPKWHELLTSAQYWRLASLFAFPSFTFTATLLLHPVSGTCLPKCELHQCLIGIWPKLAQHKVAQIERTHSTHVFTALSIERHPIKLPGNSNTLPCQAY